MYLISVSFEDMESKTVLVSYDLKQNKYLV